MNLFRLKRLIVVIISLFVISSCFNSDPKENKSSEIAHPEIEIENMQSNYQDDNSAWEELDPELRKTVNFEYDSTGNKRKFFEKYYDLIGVPALVDFLESKFPFCHTQGHDLGRTVFSRELEFDKSLNLCGNGCTFGCMHGVVAEAFGNEKYKDILKSVNSLCGEISGNFETNKLTDITKGMDQFCSSGEMANQYTKGNCAHAMGHALLGLSQNNLEKSIETCKNFEKEGMGYFCATGAFMQYVENLVIDKEYLNIPGGYTSHYPCDVYDDYPAACYRYMIGIIAYRKGLRADQMVSECKNQEDHLRKGCFHALGHKFMSQIVKNPELIKTVCLTGNRDDRIMCIEGVIERLVEIDEELTLEVCSVLDGENRQFCDDAAAQRKYNIDKPTIGLYCK